MAPPVAAVGAARPAGLQWLQAQLRLTVEGHSAFGAEVAKDLGGDKFRRLVGLAREGVRRALRAVEARACFSETTLGGVRTGCAIFDGLRTAKRCIALTLLEAQEATALTAGGVAALKELNEQLGSFVVAAQGELGAAKSLRMACESLRVSGLDGVEELIEELESAVSTANRVTQGLEDAEPVALAGSLRRIESDLRPLIRSLDPMDKNSSEVLWETRVVSVGDIMSGALRDARSEVGAWAICADAAREVRNCGDRGVAEVAAAYETASAWLRDEGLEAGLKSLHVVRKALNMNVALTPAKEDEPQLAPLLQDVPRWLRDFVGAAAIMRDTAEHRLGACGSSVDSSKIQRALLRTAEALDAGPELCTLAPWRSAMVPFQEAIALAPSCGLQTVLSETDVEVLQVLGPAWTHVPEDVGIAPAALDVVVSDDEPRAEVEGTGKEAGGGQAAGTAPAERRGGGQQAPDCKPEAIGEAGRGVRENFGREMSALEACCTVL